MNRITNYLVEHTWQAWALALLIAVGAGLLAGGLSRSARIDERSAQLGIRAERRSVELMSQTMNGNQMGAIGLLGLIDEQVKQEARNLLSPNSSTMTLLMENIARLHDADGTYVVGQDGIIKSSWGVGKPLTGVDVKFRPYFQMAYKGKQNVYAAIGTTTGRRNLYFATPMYAGNRIDTPVIGAVVMRSGVVRLDKLITESADHALLLSPQGVVFSASNQDWIGKAGGTLTPERIKEIRKLKQFGTMFDTKDPEPLPFAITPGTTLMNGNKVAVVNTTVNWNDPFGDWKLVLIEDLSRTVPMAGSTLIALGTAALLMLITLLLFTLLRSHHAKTVAWLELADYARFQEVAAIRKSQIAAASVRLQQANGLAELVQTFLAETHTIFDVLQGVVYLYDNQCLRLVGSYACSELPPEEIKPGEGMLGQVAVELRTRVLETAPNNFMMIRSGLGKTAPASVIMLPALLNEMPLGVVELALLRVPGTEEQGLIEELASLLAMNIEIVGRRDQTEEMLSLAAVAERSKTEQLAFQQALVDTIPYPVFTKDADARFISFNRAYEQTFNVCHEELVGKQVLDLEYLPEADRIAYQTEDEAVIASVGSVQREALILFADGKLHETLYFVSGFRGPDGTPGGLVGTFIDISALKNAEREMARLNDIERFNRLAQGREQRIIELKQEINALAQELGRTAPYATTLVETVGDHEFKPHPDYRTTIDKPDANLQLGDLVDLGELQTMLSNFCESVGIASAIIDLNGTILAAARWQRACTDFHRVNADSCASCVESDTELALRLQDGKEYTIYRCSNGMTDCASPIFVEGIHLANVFIGQFHTVPPDLEFFRNQAHQYGYDEADYLQAVSAAPVIDEQRLPSILGFLTRFARMISSMSFARRQADAAQQQLQHQAGLLRQERLAALSLAEDAEQARRTHITNHQESRI